MQRSSVPSGAPLTPAVLHVLLVLARGEMHGYGVMKQIEADSRGKMRMGPGTLYGSLSRMMDAQLIQESEKRVDPALDDARRVYYRITALGQTALRHEIERYRHVVSIADQAAAPKARDHGFVA